MAGCDVFISISSYQFVWIHKRLSQKISYKESKVSNFTLADGRFKLLRELGFGATASVHLAMDNLTKKTCAVKILSHQYLRSKDALPRMQREFEMLSQLQDPHIIRIYEIFHEPPFFSMEFIDGQSLDRWNEHFGTMPEEMIILLGRILTKTLAKAHDKGIIHRDIKPSNILIKPDQTPVIADFGMMRVEHAEGITATGIAIGTMGYIAPEQFHNAKAASKQADIYSLGITLLCLASGSPPVSTTQLLEKSQSFLSPELLHILMRATLENPSLRTQNMNDLHKKLQRLSLPTDGEATTKSFYLPISANPALSEQSTLP